MMSCCWASLLGLVIGTSLVQGLCPGTSQMQNRPSRALPKLAMFTSPSCRCWDCCAAELLYKQRESIQREREYSRPATITGSAVGNSRAAKNTARYFTRASNHYACGTIRVKSRSPQIDISPQQIILANPIHTRREQIYTRNTRNSRACEPKKEFLVLR